MALGFKRLSTCNDLDLFKTVVGSLSSDLDEADSGFIPVLA